ncbi:MAG: hypothetical protein ACKOCS_19215, partial [Microcystis sp.]
MTTDCVENLLVSQAKSSPSGHSPISPPRTFVTLVLQVYPHFSQTSRQPLRTLSFRFQSLLSS